MTRLVAWISALCLGVVLTASTAHAGPITYGVSRVIGAGSVVGTITTDGTIGVLTDANVLGWTLLLNDGTNSFTLHGPNTLNNSDLLISGSGLVGSDTGLFYDFSVVGFALFQNPSIGSGINYWCLEGPSANCTGFNFGETVTVANSLNVTPEGRVEIGSAVAVVPEPATLLLVGLGLAAVAGRRLSRKS